MWQQYGSHFDVDDGRYARQREEVDDALFDWESLHHGSISAGNALPYSHSKRKATASNAKTFNRAPVNVLRVPANVPRSPNGAPTSAHTAYNGAPTGAHIAHNGAPTSAHTAYNGAPTSAHTAYNGAPTSAHIAYNGAPTSAHIAHNGAPTSAHTAHNGAPINVQRLPINDLQACNTHGYQYNNSNASAYPLVHLGSPIQQRRAQCYEVRPKFHTVAVRGNVTNRSKQHPHFMEDVSGLRISSDETAEQQENTTHKDLYRLPPTEVLSIEDWKTRCESDEHENCTVQPEPAPDYSDSDDDDSKDVNHNMPQSEDHEDYVAMRNCVVKPHLSHLLTLDEWTNIVSTAEGGEDISIPDPDYDENGDTGDSACASPTSRNGQLVSPKKLANPVLDSKERQQLHRELLLNQKMGVDVLHRKSELKKEMERRKELQKKKEEEEYYRTKRSSFEQKLEEQANKLKVLDEEKEKEKTIPEESNQPEFLRVHSKIIRTQQH